MYVGVQSIGTSKKELEFLTRHGVTHMDTAIDPDNLDQIVKQREEAAAEGVELETIHIPIAKSITLAQDPQRDKDIDAICGWIENAGKAGLRGLNYNFSVVGYQRTEIRYGRGGSGFSSFEFSKYDNEEPHEGGQVDRDEIYARAAYFLERVIPVAEKHKVTMACHLPDPPAPVLRGEERWNFPVFEGLKRFSELVDSAITASTSAAGWRPKDWRSPARSCLRSRLLLRAQEDLQRALSEYSRRTARLCRSLAG